MTFFTFNESPDEKLSNHGQMSMGNLQLNNSSINDHQCNYISVIIRKLLIAAHRIMPNMLRPAESMRGINCSEQPTKELAQGSSDLAQRKPREELAQGRGNKLEEVAKRRSAQRRCNSVKTWLRECISEKKLAESRGSPEKR